MAKTTSTAKTFGLAVSQDYQILEGGQVFGTLRVRPSGLLWKPKGAKGAKAWFSIRIEDFADFAIRRGAKADR